MGNENKKAPGGGTPENYLTIEELESLLQDVDLQIGNQVRIEVTGTSFKGRHEEMGPKRVVIKNSFDNFREFLNRGVTAIYRGLRSHRSFKRISGLCQTCLSEAINHCRNRDPSVR